MPQLFRKTPTGYEPVSVDPSSPTTKDNDAPAAAQLPSSVFQFIKIIGVFLLLVFVSVVLMGTGALNSSTVTAILDDIGNSNSNSNNNNNGNNNNDNNNNNNNNGNPTPPTPPQQPENLNRKGTWGSAPPAGLSPTTENFGFFDKMVRENKREAPNYSEFPNGDVTDDAYPSSAWQIDAVYMNHFLDASAKYVKSVMDGIVEEYGGNDKLFHVAIKSADELHGISDGTLEQKTGGGLGYIEEESFDGLSRRLMHAIMTNDVFSVTIGGHSSTAGHGNNFNQSYAIVLHETLSPVFAKLGMTFVGRNMAQGGLGTVQTSLCGGDVYGYDNDIVMWDSMMTEQQGTAAIDLFYRQAVLSGNRSPMFIMTQPTCHRKNVCNQVLALHDLYGVDIGHNAMSAWTEPFTSSVPRVQPEEANIDEIPYSLKYMQCEKGVTSCDVDENKYNSVCWVERPDITPKSKQDDKTEGHAGWHPGWRQHQLKGRQLSYMILEGLENALTKMITVTSEAGSPMPSEHWHLTNRYNKIRESISSNPQGKGEKDRCFEVKFFEGLAEGVQEKLMNVVCGKKMQCRTEFTPRADPGRNLRSLIGENYQEIERLKSPQEEYEGFDVAVEGQQVPEGSVDVLSIAKGMPTETRALEASKTGPQTASTVRATHNSLRRTSATTWKLSDKVKAGVCDGSNRLPCGRNVGSRCLMYGHNDARGAVVGGKDDGAIVFRIGDDGVQNGLIMARYQDADATVKATVKTGEKVIAEKEFKADKEFVLIAHDQDIQGNDVSVSFEIVSGTAFSVSHLYWS